MVNVFSVQIFFIIFRETIETSVIISVLLAFVKQGIGNGDPQLYKKLVWQIWIGAAIGLGICLAIGGAFIAVFYTLGKDIWAKSEDLWEGIFCLVATIMITVMGLAMLRINKMKEKWRIKIAQALLETNKGKRRRNVCSSWAKKYALALLPFITTLREGLEAVVFVGGVSLGTPATAFPLPVVCGVLAGVAVGLFLYYGGNQMHMQVFLVISTCFLYLIGAGLWSRSVWFFQNFMYVRKVGSDVAEAGSGPGSYDIRQSVWHVNCCNPETDNGWEIFNAILGWQNSATYGSIISYNLFWLFIIAVILCLQYEEKHGHFPFLERFRKKKLSETEVNDLVLQAEAATKVQFGTNDTEMQSVPTLTPENQALTLENQT